MKQKILDWIQVFFGLRKFILMLILYSVGVVFRIHGLINGGEMVDLFKSTTIAFMSVNGLEHFTGMVKEYVNNRAPQSTNGPATAPDDDDKEVSIAGTSS